MKMTVTFEMEKEVGRKATCQSTGDYMRLARLGLLSGYVRAQSEAEEYCAQSQCV